MQQQDDKQSSLKMGKIRDTSLVVQWLRLHASNAGGAGLIPGWGTKILHAVWHSQKQKRGKIENKARIPGEKK